MKQEEHRYKYIETHVTYFSISEENTLRKYTIYNSTHTNVNSLLFTKYSYLIEQQFLTVYVNNEPVSI